MLDRDRGSREPRSHQHRVLRLFDRSRALFSVRSRVAPLPELAGQPIPRHDGVRFLSAMGEGGTGGPALRCRAPNRRASSRSRSEGLRASLPGLREMAQKSNRTRSPTSRTLAVLCLLPVPAGPREDSGRDGIRRGGFRHFKGGARANREGVRARAFSMAENGSLCSGLNSLKPSLTAVPFLKTARDQKGLFSRPIPDQIMAGRRPSPFAVSTACKRGIYPNPPRFRRRVEGEDWV